ncbi:MAG: class I SAM-dependent methyltransferase, partial [Methanobacteriota archaeon]
MAEHFTGSPEKLFQYWQDENRARKFLSGGTREAAIEFCRSFKTHFAEKVWMDIGTGTGYVVKKLLHDYRPKAIIGIDISKAMLAMYQVEDALLAISSAFNLPFRDRSVDAISTFFCLSDYPSLTPFLHQVKRTLRNEGIFLFVDYAKGDGYWELRKKHHGENGIVGNINLRTT